MTKVLLLSKILHFDINVHIQLYYMVPRFL